MNKLFLLLLLTLTINSGFAQSDIEKWRANGYQAKIEENYDTAIMFYGKILKVRPQDYDAQLAVARLYFAKKNYDKSISFYEKIIANDTTDVEALKGLGDNYLYLDKIDKAINYYKKAISYLPDNVPLYFQLATAYIWYGKLDNAIATYKKIATIDNTYSEAYQGIGKMYHWKEQPYTALQYYEKAIALDPLEKSINKEYEQIKKQTLYNISSISKFVNETEENYAINALIQQIGIQKRLNDNFQVSVNFLIDHSDRNFENTEIGDTIRWYNSTWAKAAWFYKHHKVYIYGGYSQSDRKFSAYGINWKWSFSLKSFDITNNLTSGYDYFYYWNEVGQNAATDNLKIRYKKMKLSLGYSYGIVDKVFILDVPNDRYEEDINPFNGYGGSLSYQILSKPKITLAANYSYLSYKYKSNRYYSPLGRNLYGTSVFVYYPIGNFYFYGDFSYNLGEEYYYENINSVLEKHYLNAENWAVNTEFGYDNKYFSASVSASRFYNDFYNNILISLNLQYGF
ncbi:MAG TPA: tetratricopeptide repeat protein [Bacteroidales bacterium]|nr:tetratricopeptide repeat protein [Bacteroidales bacterium]